MFASTLPAMYSISGDTGNGVRLATASAKPNGLDPAFAPAWANFFSKWLTAYKNHGIGPFWGVTVQNEPEAVRFLASFLVLSSLLFYCGFLVFLLSSSPSDSLPTRTSASRT